MVVPSSLRFGATSPPMSDFGVARGTDFGLAMANYAGEAGLKGKTVQDDREISSCCSLT